MNIGWYLLLGFIALAAIVVGGLIGVVIGVVLFILLFASGAQDRRRKQARLRAPDYQPLSKPGDYRPKE
jgi:hypothetical protein